MDSPHKDTEQSTPDQRRHPRYRLKNAVIITPAGICEVVNISWSGLAFRGNSDSANEQFFSFDLLDTKGDHLQDMQAEIVWREETDRESSGPKVSFDYIFGARFREITTHQHDVLENLISSGTMDGSVSPPASG